MVLVLEAEAIVSGWAGVVVVGAVVGVVADGTAPALPCCCSRRAGVAAPRGWLRACWLAVSSAESELSDRCSPGIDEQQQQFRGRLHVVHRPRLDGDGSTREKSGRVVNAAVGGTRA